MGCFKKEGKEMVKEKRLMVCEMEGLIFEWIVRLVFFIFLRVFWKCRFWFYRCSVGLGFCFFNKNLGDVDVVVF